jgi:DNA-binding NtrC family response regulator
MQALRERVRQVATSSAPTLVRAERGSESDVVAHVIHRRSGRAGRFVEVACAGLPETVLEAELLGFAAGAHAAAADERTGLFAQASDGTLFLDEIGELPLMLQGKLLRVLETGRYRPLGGAERPLTARIVAATTTGLEALVESGRFRADLLLRIDVLRVEVPALRERDGDIVPLAYRMVDELNRLEGRGVRRLPSAALRVLEAWAWPGNMDELRNALRRAVVLSRGEDLELEGLQLTGLPFGEGLDTASAARRIVSRVSERHGDGPFGSLFDLPYADAKMRAVEWFTGAYLQHHLAATRGNITQAAERTGMARPNFSRLMRRFEIEIDRGLSEAIAQAGGAEAGDVRQEPLSSR